jgi:glycosyltransferase involved in cell wall biosynthesis
MTSAERADGGASPPLPTVSVVVPTHNRRDRLPALLEALEASSALEFVVAVNGRDDDSLELLEARAEREPRLRPTFVPEPGQMRALRAGVELGRGEVVLMLDDDVVPEPGLVEGHAHLHAAGEHRVGLGYMPVLKPRRRRRGQYPIEIYSRSYELACDEYERDPTAVLRALWAGNVSIRPADFLRVAATGERGEYGYHEDRDFGLRCEQAGLEGVFDRRLLARHHFDKTPQAFLAASRDSGRTRAEVHAAHPEAVGPLAEDSFALAVPQPGRTLVQLARSELLYPPIQGALRAMAWIAGSLRLFRLETHLGYVAGTIEQQRGARAAMGLR